MGELYKLAKKYGSDKCSDKHNYMPVYEKLFEPIKNNKLNILELGVANGASIRMWLDYFPNSFVMGVDSGNNPMAFNDNHMDRFIYLQKDQVANDLYEDIYENLFTKTLTYYFDIIIDDCSHIAEYTIYTFIALRGLLTSDGFYIVEDSAARNLKGSRYTNEILGKYGEVKQIGAKDSMIIIRP